jgi:hypothetical protein
MVIEESALNNVNIIRLRGLVEEKCKEAWTKLCNSPNEGISEMDIIVKSFSGSRLYGTDTDDSDTDFISVYLPTFDQLIVGDYPDEINLNTSSPELKNLPSDTDHTVYSIHRFLQLCIEGKQQAIDLLYGNPNKLLQTSLIWDSLLSLRHMFVSKDLIKIIDFLNRQISCYGNRDDKGLSKIHSKIEDLLSSYDKDTKIYEIAHELHVDRNAYFVTNMNKTLDIVEWSTVKTCTKNVFYRICGKSFEVSLTLGNLSKAVNLMVLKSTVAYIRTKQNINWKEVCHALRIGYQTRYILTERGFTYPLPETDFLMQAKQGKLNFINQVQPELEKLVSEIRYLLDGLGDKIPEKVDKEFWRNWLISNITSFIF